MSVWMSALLGAGLGIANVTASYVLWRLAQGRDQRAFMTLVLGGMVVRLIIVLLVVALVIVLLPVARAPFVGTFFAAFAAGTVVEVLLIQRRAKRLRADASAPAS